MANIKKNAHGFMSKTLFSLIPDDFENESGTDRVWKNISGSGRLSGTHWSLVERKLFGFGSGVGKYLG